MKRSKINEIIENKVLKKLTEKFQEKGFKYKKGIKGFYKRDKELLSEITISDRLGLFMVQEGVTERYNDLYITFEIFFKTGLYEFEKWYKEHFGVGDHLRIDTFHKVLEFCILAKEGTDFIIPDDISANQREYFGEEKRLIKILPDNIYQFASWDMIDEVDDFDAHINKVFDTLEEMITTRYDLLQLYNREKKDDLGRYNSEYMKYNALLIYDGQLALPTKFIIEKCNNVIAEIDQMTDETQKEQRIRSLNRFISIAEKHLHIKIDNPYKK